MKKLFNIFFIMIAFTTIFVLSGCDSTVAKSQVPVYQGMTISRNVSGGQVRGQNLFFAKKSQLMLSSDDEASDTQIEFDDHNNEDNEIENDIRNLIDIDVEADDVVKYYVGPNEIFVIAVHISNPNQYEIQSFTLNGRKYANYMFKEGSTMETLLLEVTAPANSGYTEYTIDAIKYIDKTEIKDVDMSSGNKSIKAGVAYQNAPSAYCEAINIETTRVALKINVADANSLIENNTLEIYLSDGLSIVDNKRLHAGVNDIVFDNLSNDTNYQYGVVATFDLVDGRDLHSEWLLRDAFKTLNIFVIKNIDTTKTSIQFEVEKTGQVGQINAIKIYDSVTHELILSKTSDTRIFDELLSNHAYDIYVEFSYAISGEETYDWVCVKQIKTQEKILPVVSISNLTSTKTSVDYEIETSDSDNILTITKVELLHATQDSRENGINLNGSFNNLLSNNSYTLKVTYTYDLNDGRGLQTTFVSQAINTIAKVAPTIALSNENITENSIEANLNINDEDSICVLQEVSLYEDNALIETNALKEIDFDGLKNYTSYIVVALYYFNLNDGTGIHETSFVKEYKTLPYFAFNSCRIINTSAVSEGETIYMQVSLDNPSGAMPSSVVINSLTYNCTGSTTSSKIYVEVVNDGQFEGGDTLLTIEKVNMSLDGKVYSIEPSANNSSSIFINGIVTIESLKIVNASSLEEVDHFFPSDEIKLLLTVNNKTGYNIGTSDYSIQKIDNNHFFVDVYFYSGWNSFSLSSISYSNEYLSKWMQTDITSNWAFKLEQDGIVHVTTASQLKNMEDRRMYSLENDIDLTGENWNDPGNFFGYFEGNGHTISNLSIAKNYETEEVTLGLFKHASGVVKNLNLDDFVIMANFETMPHVEWEGIGALCGGATNIIVSNVRANFDSSITRSNFPILNIGGLIGSCRGYFDIERCYVQANLSGSVNNEGGAYCYIGGIVGSSETYDGGTIRDCFCASHINIPSNNHGTVTYCGGIISRNGGDINVENTISYINFSGNSYGSMGGIIAVHEGGKLKILNCAFSTMDDVGYYYGSLYQDRIISSINSILDLSDEFVSSFDENIWDFNDFDFGKHIYPILK